MGIPPPFLTYLSEFYSRSQTRIRVSDRKSDPINVRRGVKQGDPLSVHLFNAVIDWAVSTLEPSLGVMVAGSSLNHLAFADDIGLLTRTSVGAQSQINRLSEHLGKCGLTKMLYHYVQSKAAIPDKTISYTCHILPKLSKTCHKPKKIPPCPPKSMLSVGGFVDRCFRDMTNIVRWGKGGGFFET